ncbi:hypothetical protein RB653_003769 [Dictyostelium firmibasis]|uniref:protein-tyrosine-phosphatase n=1 Tax=Dictyostelium firmibasis TaxID=79012 RepID=A0AAN7YXE6_9MYCE
MDKFVIVKCINPGFVAPKKDESKKDEPKKDEPKKDEPKKIEPKKEEIKSEPKKKRTTKPKSNDTSTLTSNNDSIKTTTTTTPTTTLNPEVKKPQQTLVSHFFTMNTGDKPSYKFLFEKEAADRAEEERKRAERIAKEEEILAEKRKQIQKAKLEAKKKREAERRKREEEEWEEYLAMQEKTTKGIEIIPHLYLGSFLAAKNSEWLLEANVTKIVNVTSEVPSYFLSKKEKEKDKVISEKDQIDSFIVDDEDIDDEDIDDEDIDDEDGDNEDEDSDEDNDDVFEENVDIDDNNDDNKENKDEKDEQMKNIDNYNIKEMNKDDSKSSMEKDQEMKDVKETISSSSTDELKEKQIEDVSTTITTSITSIKIDQVNEDVDGEKVKELNIKYLRISISDSSRSKIENYFQEAIDFINQGNVDGCEKSNVLIHCKQGRSRSPSIVIAYLMSNEKWTLEKAFNHVSNVSPKNLTVNDGFKKKLMDLEMELFDSNSINFFDRSNRSSRASISSTLNITEKRIKSQNKKKDTINDKVIDDDKNNEDTRNEENIVDNTAVALSTNLEVEDDASTIDQLKVVKRRKNITIVEDEE